MEKQIALESNAEYEVFVDKFKPKLTTDDCAGLRAGNSGGTRGAKQKPAAIRLPR